mmetsp:Transcript_2599/g.3941  ORF Transcript_2599/g.3941 Transcript_2599/m.3941 type:complete len:183 (+) Transcript_2599:2-550(+)
MTVVSARGGRMPGGNKGVGGRPSSALEENPCRQDRLKCLDLETEEEKKECMQGLPNRPECPNREALRECNQLESEEDKKACLEELREEGGLAGARPGSSRPGGRPEGGRPGDKPDWMTDEIKAEIQECFEFDSRDEIKVCVTDIMEEYKEEADDGQDGDAGSDGGFRSLAGMKTMGYLRGEN